MYLYIILTVITTKDIKIVFKSCFLIMMTAAETELDRYVQVTQTRNCTEKSIFVPIFSLKLVIHSCIRYA